MLRRDGKEKVCQFTGQCTLSIALKTVQELLSVDGSKQIERPYQRSPLLRRRWVVTDGIESMFQRIQKQDKRLRLYVILIPLVHIGNAPWICGATYVFMQSAIHLLSTYYEQIG